MCRAHRFTIQRNIRHSALSPAVIYLDRHCCKPTTLSQPTAMPKQLCEHCNLYRKPANAFREQKPKPLSRLLSNAVSKLRSINKIDSAIPTRPLGFCKPITFSDSIKTLWLTQLPLLRIIHHFLIFCVLTGSLSYNKTSSPSYKLNS